MGRIHSGYDIYVGDDLLWSRALISEDQHAHVIKVKARDDKNRWAEVYRLTDTGRMMQTTARAAGEPAGLQWTGSHDGEQVTVTALRVGGGCIPCSRR